MKREDTVPSNAAWLGALGALPFMALAGLSSFMRPDNAWALYALATYGAVILSFLGGIHWGMAIGRSNQMPATSALVLSVVPSLVSWGALLLSPRSGLLLLAAAVGAMFFVDANLTRRGLAPPWYPRLRLPLSIIVATCLLIGAWFAA